MRRLPAPSERSGSIRRTIGSPVVESVVVIRNVERISVGITGSAATRSAIPALNNRNRDDLDVHNQGDRDNQNRDKNRDDCPAENHRADGSTRRARRDFPRGRLRGLQIQRRLRPQNHRRQRASQEPSRQQQVTRKLRELSSRYLPRFKSSTEIISAREALAAPLEAAGALGAAAGAFGGAEDDDEVGVG